MKKQTTDETLPRKEVETLIDNVRTSTKASVLADVEKWVNDLSKSRRTGDDCFFLVSELKQEIARLKGEGK